MSHQFCPHCAHSVSFEHVSVESDGVPILSDINASIPRGGCTAIVGPNGAGKTTLVLTLLDEIPYQGTIRFHGYDSERPRFGYVPQSLSFDRGMPLTVLEFMETLKADQVLQEKLRTLPNVAVHTNVQTLEVEGDGSRMTALRTKDRPTGAEKRLPLDGVFVQIGLSANSKLFAGILDTNRAGEILTDKECRTSVPGVYAAGDVTDIRYKQIVIAMGEGAKAALSASEDRIKGII